MHLIATVDSASVIDGRTICLKKGDPYRGSGKETERLLSLGLVEKPKPKKKGQDDD